MDSDINILDYENLVYKNIVKYQKHYDKDDLYQVGMLGLKKALDNYKPNQNTKFSSFAWFYIKGEIYKYIRESNYIKISPDIIRLNNSINKAKELMSQKLGREATYEEISLYLDIDYDKVIEAVNSSQRVESLDNDMEQDNLYNHIMIEEENLKPEIMDLKLELSKLTKEEQEIIIDRYYNDLTQSEVSKKLGITQVQVSRKESKVLTKLKNNL